MYIFQQNSRYLIANPNDNLKQCICSLNLFLAMQLFNYCQNFFLPGNFLCC